MPFEIIDSIAKFLLRAVCAQQFQAMYAGVSWEAI